MAEIKGGKEADIKICIPSSAVDPGSKYKAAVPRLVVNGEFQLPCSDDSKSCNHYIYYDAFIFL